METSEEFSGSNAGIIAKRRRTKRQRPSSYSTATSTTSSTEISTTTDQEDEEMANCLILLARGGNTFTPSSPEKICSRRLMNDTKFGIYVYECKTCNRTFPSFQALGGHRASHNKPRITTITTDQDQEDQEVKFTTQLIINKSDFPIRKKAKIHECSICGTEFASGQALGGHMRRHRLVTNTTTTTNNNSGGLETNLMNDMAFIGHENKKMDHVFELDLNLPAPPEDDRRESKFDQFPAVSQQRSLVLSVAV